MAIMFFLEVFLIACKFNYNTGGSLFILGILLFLLYIHSGNKVWIKYKFYFF